MCETEIEKLVGYEADEQTQGVDCRDNVKHIERSDQLFLARMMLVAEQGWQETKSECCEDVEQRWGYGDMEVGWTL